MKNQLSFIIRYVVVICYTVLDVIAVSYVLQKY